MDYETETLLAHSLRGGGFDASEDGTGRGTPIVTVGALACNTGPNGHDAGNFACNQAVDAGHLIAFDTTQITSKTNRCQPQNGDPCHPIPAHGHAPAIAFSSKDHGADAGETSPTLRAGNHTNSHANSGVPPAIAFQSRASHQNSMTPSEISPPLDVGKAGGDTASLGSSVRRLTPRECERLQGFKDDYTLIPMSRGLRKTVDAEMAEYYRRTQPELPDHIIRTLAADGPRYKALGNSMAVPVMAWIGERISLVEVLP